jgi:hypothetical protein
MKEEQGEHEGGSGNQAEEENQAKEQAKEKAGQCPAFFTSRLTSSVTPGSL